MLIIIEGVDGSGKTTFANSICEVVNTEHPATYLHRGVPEQHVLDEYELPLFDYVPFDNKTIVCDRWHIGPDVYGPIKRNDDGLDPVIRWHINAFLASKGALVIYTEMPIEGLLERLRSRGEDYLHESEVASVIEKYHDAISMIPLPIWLSTTGVHSIIDAITCARTAEASANQSGWIRSYVGPRRPQVLYVVEPTTPIACMPYEGTEAYQIVDKYALQSEEIAGFVNADEDCNLIYDTDIFFLICTSF